MSFLQQAKQLFLVELKTAIGKNYTPTIDEIGVPPNASMGDLAYPCFALAKGLRRNPAEIATELAAKIGPKGFLKSITAQGPYVNVVLDDAVFGTELLAGIASVGSAFGSNTEGAQKTVMVEYAQPNTHKEIHVGHLRNFFVGQTLVNVLRANGYTVLPTSYINDLGLHVAKCLWGIKRFHADEKPTKETRMKLLQDAYVEATKEEEINPEVKKEISQIYQDLEAGKRTMRGLWKTTRTWSMQYMKSVFAELGLTIEYWYYESDLLDATRSLLESLIPKGILQKSEGAWIVDLTDQKLGVNLLIRTDGTLLYNAKDLALAQRKEDDHHPMRSLYVIDVRQSLAMQQLQATLRKMGVEKEIQHLSYEFVTLKDGTMSSRKGNVIRYEEFRDSLKDLARLQTRKRHPDWSEKKIEKTAAGLAFAAMRFTMLKQDLDKIIVFDLEEALQFDGFTGPYLLYTYARIQSLLRKSRKVTPVFTGAHMKHPSEHRLLMTLAQYEDVVSTSAHNLHLSSLAQYAFELSKRFAEWYEQVPVLTAQGEELVASRLGLAVCVGHVLKNVLDILGIEPLEEM